MSIDQKRIRNVFWNDTSLIDVHVVNVVNDVDATALASIGWLDNPDILLALVLLEFLVVIIEVTEFVGQDVSVRAEVEGILAESLL